MSNIIENFLNAVLEIIPELESEYDEAKESWLPKSPPLTLLLSDFARSINQISLGEQRESLLFDKVERALTSGDPKLEDAIATGFLETLYDEYLSAGKVNNSFWHKLGSESTKHLEGVIKFYDGN